MMCLYRCRKLLFPLAVLIGWILILSSNTFLYIQEIQSVKDKPVEIIKVLPKKMKVVGLYQYLPINETDSFLNLRVPLPTLRKNDVLVEVKVTGVNVIDITQRTGKQLTGRLWPERTAGFPRILGWDGSGIIADKGNSEYFDVGDEVFFAAIIHRNGTNAQFVAVDELMVEMKPKSLTFEDAATMPLSTLTAYEALSDRLFLSVRDKGKALFIINSGEGVGVVATTFAKTLGLRVIGTSSRDETVAFSLKHGADIVLNDTYDLLPQLKSRGYGTGVDFILVNADAYPIWHTLTAAAKPQSRICHNVESSGLIDLNLLKEKSLTLVGQTLGTRVTYNTPDKYRYRDIYAHIISMIESGELKSTLEITLSPINAKNLKEAHLLIEDKKVVGRVVVTGFSTADADGF